MDLLSLLQWWDEWQLSVLVLGSLGVKCFLAVAAAARKSNISPVYRFLVWLSYLGGDALAIYALAALLNIQKKAAQDQESLAAAAADGGSRALQLLWAPIMLMHLGGLANISAYNIEDNELWKRHIATSISQVAVALYVFCKLWSSSADKRLLAAAILLFIPGVFKCFEKPLALRRSSFYNLVSKPTTTTTKEPRTLQDYIEAAKAALKEENESSKKAPEIKEKQCLKNLSRADKLFVDLARPYWERACAAESFWHLKRLKDGAEQEAIRVGISNTFNLLYTKDFTQAKKERDENPLDLMCSLSTWLLCLLVPIAAIGLLHSGRTEAYRGSDVKITFVLLYLTLLVDACSIFSLNISHPWHAMVAQHNLMELFALNRRHPWLARAAELVGCEELLDHLFFRMEPRDSSGLGGISSAVLDHVQKGWNEFIEVQDVESYSRFSDMRGQWTLWREGCNEVLSWSLALGRPFDEAVLVWHLATDLCLSSLRKSETAVSSENKELATQISNYMMHLLFSNPEMLMPGSSKELCTRADKQMKSIFNLENADDNKEETGNTVADRLLDHALSSPRDDGFVYDAWRLAHELEELGDKDKEREWKVIRGVWVEMLCFSAIRCRGYLHAKSLGSGGEYLTFVWLLMAHAGLETFPERQQRPRMMLQPPRD